MKLKHIKTAVTLFFFSLLFACVGCDSEASEQKDTEIETPETTSGYYWSNGKKYALNKAEGKEYILFKTSDSLSITSPSNGLEIISQPKKVRLSGGITLTDSPLAIGAFSWAIVGLTSATPKRNPAILYNVSFYTNAEGTELGLSHLFYVKLKDANDIGKLTELASKNNVEVIGYNKDMPLWYTVGCTNQSKGNALEMANLFYETNFFAESQPDLMGGVNTMGLDGR